MAKVSLEATQARYKKDFDKRVHLARKLGAGESMYLDTNDGVKKWEKPSDQVAGPFQILKENKNNILVIQRCEVVETVSANCVTYASSSAKPIESGHKKSPVDL